MDDDLAVRLCIMIVGGGSSMRFDIKDQNYYIQNQYPSCKSFLTTGEFDFRTTLGAGRLDASFIFLLSSVGRTPTHSVTCRSDDCLWGRIHDVWDNVAMVQMLFEKESLPLFTSRS